MAVLLCIFFFLNFFFLMDYKIIVNIFKVAYGFYTHTKIYSNSTKFSKQKELNESFYSSNQNQKKKTKKIQWIIRFIDVFPCIPTIQFLLFSFLFVGTIDFNDLISYKKTIDKLVHFEQWKYTIIRLYRKYTRPKKTLRPIDILWKKKKIHQIFFCFKNLPSKFFFIFFFNSINLFCSWNLFLWLFYLFLAYLFFKTTKHILWVKKPNSEFGCLFNNEKEIDGKNMGKILIL